MTFPLDLHFSFRFLPRHGTQNKMPTPSDGRRPTNQTRRKSYDQNRTENVSAHAIFAVQNSKVIGGIDLPVRIIVFFG